MAFEMIAEDRKTNKHYYELAGTLTENLIAIRTELNALIIAMQDAGLIVRKPPPEAL